MRVTRTFILGLGVFSAVALLSSCTGAMSRKPQYEFLNDMRQQPKYGPQGESDFGADRVWRFSSQLMTTDTPRYAQLAAALAPLGITKNDKGEADGTDVEATIAAGAPWISLGQDGTRYFDWHHTPDDTLDKIDPVQLRQNVAAWTAALAVLSGGIDTGAKQPKRR